MRQPEAEYHEPRGNAAADLRIAVRDLREAAALALTVLTEPATPGRERQAREMLVEALASTRHVKAP